LVIGGITVLLNTIFIFPTWWEQLIPPVIGLAVYLPILRRYYPRYEYRADKHATDKGYGDELISVLQKEGKESGVLAGSIRGFVYPSAEERIKKIRENIGD
jgi:Zn-dependent protease with chaperone function